VPVSVRNTEPKPKRMQEQFRSPIVNCEERSDSLFARSLAVHVLQYRSEKIGDKEASAPNQRGAQRTKRLTLLTSPHVVGSSVAHASPVCRRGAITYVITKLAAISVPAMLNVQTL
jgi:hypothetical protein